MDINVVVFWRMGQNEWMQLLLVSKTKMSEVDEIRKSKKLLILIDGSKMCHLCRGSRIFHQANHVIIFHRNSCCIRYT